VGIRLTSRDHALLWVTWQNQIMSPRQYLRRFWPDASQQAASKRLVELKNEGLLTSNFFPWNMDRHIYTITAAGNRVLVDIGLLDLSLARDFPPRPKELTATTQHHLGVVDLRIALEETGANGSTWVSDHQLRQARRWRFGNPRAADGMFDFDAHGRQGRGVLEFERQSYRRPKMAAIMSRLRADHDGDTVFFVARSAERARRVWTWAVDARTWGDRPERFLVAPLKEVLKHGLDAGFADLDGRRFGSPEV